MNLTKQVREQLNNLYQDANAMVSFDPTIANFKISSHLKLIMKAFRECLPERRKVFVPTDKEVGEGAYYDLKIIKGHNTCLDTIEARIGE